MREEISLTYPRLRLLFQQTTLCIPILKAPKAKTIMTEVELIMKQISYLGVAAPITGSARKTSRPVLSSSAEQNCTRANKTTASRSRSLAGLIVAFLFVSVFALLPNSAKAQCTQWNAGGEWYIQQGTTAVYLTLSQDRTVITGTAMYYSRNAQKYVVKVNGSLDGTVRGDNFDVQIYWGNGPVGVYSGKIGPQGRIEGITYDRQKPANKVGWYSGRTMKCVSRRS